MSVTIKTKQGDRQYTTVAERVSMVHQANKILEVLESGPVQVGDHFIWRVLLLVDGNTYVGNAEVHLNSTNFAEKADPWATAETSAVGRALAWSGYAGTPDSIASADEIVRAESNGNDRPDTNVQDGLNSAPPSTQQLDSLKKLAVHLGEKIQRPKTYQEAKAEIERLSAAYNEMIAKGRAS